MSTLLRRWFGLRCLLRQCPFTLIERGPSWRAGCMTPGCERTVEIEP